MGIYAIHYTYPDDLTELLKVRPEHREWLTGLHGVLVAGMYQAGHHEVSEGEPSDEEPPHAALIAYEAGSIDEVVSTFEHDPYWQNGFVLRRVVREWDPPLGRWAAEEGPFGA
ncbi:MAG: YciI family protein [Intrasporangium sp.]|uniref:YciI family protein n=1 Tax=Intrasporangium sp. TaxID=1925024 RepID=UPI0026472756|nr:YciI family protein [Intrasporangium sp.]MDN5795616.1 YciI family protein [Intrasporangium sp.]